jgi:hypothetical protein
MARNAPTFATTMSRFLVALAIAGCTTSRQVHVTQTGGPSTTRTIQGSVDDRGSKCDVYLTKSVDFSASPVAVSYGGDVCGNPWTGPKP